MDYTDFSDIAPFNDEEAAAALARVSIHPNVPWISKFLFPDKPNTFLGDVLRNIHTVDEFQEIVMSKAIQWVIDNTITEFTYDGIENIRKLGTTYWIPRSRRWSSCGTACPRPRSAWETTSSSRRR